MAFVWIGKRVTIAACGTESMTRHTVREDRIVGARRDSPLEMIRLPDEVVRL